MVFTAFQRRLEIYVNGQVVLLRRAAFDKGNWMLFFGALLLLAPLLHGWDG